MNKDRLITHILTALTSSTPATEWSDYARGVYQPLFGAVIALLECKRLIEENAELLRSGRTWKLAGLAFFQVEDMYDKQGEFVWEGSQDFILWKIGFWLNRAQHNVAIAAERQVNALLGIRLGIEAGKEGEDDFHMWLYGTLPYLRYRLACILWRKQSVVVRSEELMKSLEKLYNTENAKKEIERKSNKSSLNSLERSWNALDQTIGDTDAVAMVWGLFNASKHQVLGATPKTRTSKRILAEWCILTKAVRWLGAFWQEFVKLPGGRRVQHTLRKEKREVGATVA